MFCNFKKILFKTLNIVCTQVGCVTHATVTTPYEVWYLFFTDEITENTNVWINRHKYKRENDGNVTTSSDILGVLGIVYMAWCLVALIHLGSLGRWLAGVEFLSVS